MRLGGLLLAGAPDYYYKLYFTTYNILKLFHVEHFNGGPTAYDLTPAPSNH